MLLRSEKIKRLTLFSRHPVLDQVARDIARGVNPDQLPDMHINVFVGIHKRYGRAIRRRGIKIGIQTEHYFDADGRPMWRRGKRWRILKNLLIYDRILDLSPANKKNYEWLPRFLKKRITFGPFIFPSDPVNFVPARYDRSVFFGFINDRRRNILAGLSPASIHILPDELFGPALSDEVRKYKAVLNVHFHDGKFSEFPRLLSAYLEGKPVISEELGSELTAGVHYIKPEECVCHQELHKVFSDFREDFASRYKFTDFLQAIAGTNSTAISRKAISGRSRYSDDPADSRSVVMNQD